MPNYSPDHEPHSRRTDYGTGSIDMFGNSKFNALGHRNSSYNNGALEPGDPGFVPADPKNFSPLQKASYLFCWTFVGGVCVFLGTCVFGHYQNSLFRHWREEEKQAKLFEKAQQEVNSVYNKNHPLMVRSAQLKYVPGITEKLKEGDAKGFWGEPRGFFGSKGKIVPWGTEVKLVIRDKTTPFGVVDVVLPSAEVNKDGRVVTARVDARLLDFSNSSTVSLPKATENAVLRTNSRVRVWAYEKAPNEINRKDMGVVEVPKETQVKVWEHEGWKTESTALVSFSAPKGFSADKKYTAIVPIVDLEGHEEKDNRQSPSKAPPVRPKKDALYKTKLNGTSYGK